MFKNSLSILLLFSFSFLNLACDDLGSKNILSIAAPDPTTPTDPDPDPDPPTPPIVNPDDPLEAGGVLQTLSMGHDFTEGVAYHPQSNSLLFSNLDFTNGVDEVFIINLTSGVVLPWKSPSMGTNGNAVDSNGRIFSCQARTSRRIVRYDDITDSDTFVILPELFNALQYSAPNDLAIHSNGDVYFTDPIYNSEGGNNVIPERGVIRIAADGTVTRVIPSGFEQPNGIVFSPDESILYVSDTEANLRIINPSGTLVDTVEVGEQTTNCTIGGVEKKTLFINGVTSVYSLPLRIPGV